MKHSLLSVGVVFLIVALLSQTVKTQQVLLSSINTLEFFNDKTVTSKGAEVPQMQCTGGSVSCDFTYIPEKILCKNSGNNWGCTANLDKLITLGKFKVICDPASEATQVIQESCRLEYELNWAEGAFYGGSSEYAPKDSRNTPADSTSSSNNMFYIVGGILLALAVFGFVGPSVLSAKKTTEAKAESSNNRPSRKARKAD